MTVRAGEALAAMAALLLSAVSTAGSAQAPQGAQALPDPAPLRAKALQLARLVEPNTPIDSAKAEGEFIAALRSDEALAALELEYPGILKALWDAVMPEVERQADAKLPHLWEKLAAIYTSELNLAELEAASAFLGSTTGRKMVKMVNEGMVGPGVAAAMGSEEGTISASDLNSLKVVAATRMANSLSAEEQAEISTFAFSPAGLKLQQVAPQVNATAAEWANRSDPEDEARLDALMEKAMEAFIAAAEVDKQKQ